ncbi:RnfABCDGE type electron transport complex subunit D [Acetobacterium bakii]|uniref:Ion-translocating oxidoreductase complex subunit D n=1 Tax=Acetobacterium bakii TaxID=52689 RepID=A0A0L6U1C3_9FIRM|nr:RnfABCDGE type electron transport complex subunit D [Acetobacterium bakii]KNZ42142.1 NADH:ubiquinone oxidoreductase [Acetobacterium bakii]
MNELNLTVSSSPHIRAKHSTASIMQNVIIALLPALAVAGYVFGVWALALVAICIISSVVTEAVIQKLLKKPITINDWSAVVTGVLLAFNLPVNAPWWIAVIGSVFAIAIVKQCFGGLGQNFINPALAARAFLLASWPGHMTSTAFIPLSDTVTTATPLALLKAGDLANMPSTFDLFTGLNITGCIGEISALALLLGGLYLIYKGIISWRIPFIYIATVGIFALLLGQDPLVHIASGGLMLGAFFMATDYASSPITVKGQIAYAIGCGLITMIIRQYGGYPEGVSYSILLMNVATPLIERFTKERIYGVAKKKKEVKA